VTARMARRVVSDYLVPTAALVGVLVLWEAARARSTFPTSSCRRPRPSSVKGGSGATVPRHTWVTLYETLGGFALSILVGVPLAVLIVYSPVLKSALYP